MTSYLIKSILCSGLLLMFYHFFLEGEKMHRFNRFYLLLSLAFALIIPLLTIEIKREALPVNATNAMAINNIPIEKFSEQITNQSVSINAKSESVLHLPLISYCLISLLLLVRFIRNIHSVLIRKSNHKIIFYKGAKLVLLPENVITYTFLNHIFVGEKEYNYNLIEEEILTHELAHVHQKHTLDILFIEIIQILFWFNPFIFLYKKAIQLNHEFLADDSVLNIYQNPKSYQLLLLDKILHTKKVNLTSSFNYSITKKRLVMMTTNTSKRAILIKKLILIPVICLIVPIFAFRIQSQQIDTEPVKRGSKTARSEGVSQKHFDEYQNALKKAVSKRINKGFTITDIDFSILDIQRLDVIYRSMSDEQRSIATKVNFIPMGPVPQKISPTQEQLNAWLNSKKYGVWLDEKRINNGELKQYKPSDFDYFFVSKLEKNAFNYGKHYFQVGVMSKKAFKEWHDKKVPLDAIPD